MAVAHTKWGEAGYSPVKHLSKQLSQLQRPQFGQWLQRQRVNRTYKSLGSAQSWNYPIGFVGRNQDISLSKAGAAAAYASVFETRGAIDAIRDGINFLDWNIKTYEDGIRVKQEGEIIANRHDLKPRHPLQREWLRFRKHNETSLLNLITYDMLLYGEVYIEKVHNVFGRNPSLEWLNPLGMTPFYMDKIEYFQYGWNQRFVQIPPEKVAYWHNQNPADDFIGLPLVLTVMDKANILRNLDRFLRDYFNNNALPGGLLTPKDPEATLSDQDFNTFKKLLKEEFKGVGGQFRMLASQTPVDITTFDQPDLAKNTTVADRNSEAILKVFRVPGVMLGSTANNPYKDSDEARHWFFMNVVIPLAKGIQEYINVELMSLFDDSGVTIFEFDTSPFDEVTAADQLEAAVIDVQVKGTLIDLYTAAKRQEIDPDKALKNLYMVQGVPVPLSELPTYWEKQLLVSPSVFNAPEITGEPLPAPTNPESVVPTDTGGEPVADAEVREELDTSTGSDVPRTEAEQQKAIPTETKQSYCVMGYFNDTRQILAFQDALRSHQTTMRFEDPELFHVTLLYSEDVRFGDIQKALPINPAAFSITVDGMEVFNTPHGQAIHLTIRKEGTLPAMQAALAMTAKEAGVDISPFSEPDDYKPHITLAYAEESIKHVDITPFTLLVNRIEITGDDYEPIIMQQLKSVINVDGHTYHVETRPYLPPLELQKAQLAEIKAWEKFAAKRLSKSVKDFRPFEPDYLRGRPGELLQLQLSGATSQDELKGLFNAVRERVAFKAIQATRLDFEGGFEDAMGSAMAGRINRTKWSRRINNLLKTNINKAYRDGLSDGGVLDDPDDTEQSQIDAAVKEQVQFVTNLGQTLFKEDKVTEAMAEQKAAMWFNLSIMPSYYDGFESAAANQMMEFAGDDGDENCATCARLKGQRHRLKAWESRGLNPKRPENSEKFICGLFRCEHILAPTTSKASGGF